LRHTNNCGFSEIAGSPAAQKHLMEYAYAWIGASRLL